MRTKATLGVAVGVVVTAACSGQNTPLDIPPAGDIGGAVIATDSGRVATTVLTLEGAAGGVLTADTDAGGAYFFSSVAVGDWTLTVIPAIGFVLAPGETEAKAVTVTEGQFTEVDFRVAPTAR